MSHPLAAVTSLNIFHGIFEYGGLVISHLKDFMLSSVVCEMSAIGLIVIGFQDVIDLMFSNTPSNI